MKPNDTRDVVEALVATILCSAGAMLVGWIGKKFFDMDTSDTINVYINNQPVPLDELGDGTDDETCEGCLCDECKSK